jgi:hypothetical protein
MIRFHNAPASKDPAQSSLVVGSNLDDALALFGKQDDCIGCSTAVAALKLTRDDTIERVRRTFSPLSHPGPIIRPRSGATGLLRRGSDWTEIDVDARAQRLKTVRMPSDLVASQRLIAVQDLRANTEARPSIAIGLWTEFAHPIVRTGARLAGTRDGLVAEIALAVHPDRYVIVDRDRSKGLTFVLSTPDIIVAELVALAIRELRARFRGPGPWEDPLVQAATDLNLGARNADEIDIEAVISPTLSLEQRGSATVSVTEAAERIGVAAAA